MKKKKQQNIHSYNMQKFIFVIVIFSIIFEVNAVCIVNKASLEPTEITTTDKIMTTTPLFIDIGPPNIILCSSKLILGCVNPGFTTTVLIPDLNFNQ